MSVKARVLIVDDEPDIVVNWARILAREGHTCMTATESEGALALVTVA
jgi:DNA-binding NtrC family response regulator